MNIPIPVFLCHASDDKVRIRILAESLRASGFRVWLDEEQLLPGQDWQVEIQRAVRGAAVVLVCLTHNSVTKTGFVQKEIRLALDAADERPEGTIFVIPARLESCDVPQRLRHLQWVDLFEDRGFPRLCRAIETALAALLAGSVDTEVEVDLVPEPNGASEVFRKEQASDLGWRVFGYPRYPKGILHTSRLSSGPDCVGVFWSDNYGEQLVEDRQPGWWRGSESELDALADQIVSVLCQAIERRPRQ